jgi:hypothetical protein
MTKLTVAFRDFVKELKKGTNLKMRIYRTTSRLLLFFEVKAHSHFVPVLTSASVGGQKGTTGNYASV